MITDKQREESQTRRIEILREGYGDSHPEVTAYNETHARPSEPELVGAADRLTAEEVEIAAETVPASPQGKIGGRKVTEDRQ